jgi:penicillin-binding protein 1A
MANTRKISHSGRSRFGRFLSIVNTVTWLLVLGCLILVLVGLLKFRSSYFDVRADMKEVVEIDVIDSQATRVYARDYDPLTGNGTLLTTVAEENRKDVGFYELPPELVTCLLSTEDHRFFRHRGVDLLGTARAIWRGVLSKSDIKGTSTVTQQLARNVYLANIKSEKTMNRKAQEAILALVLEQQLTKQDIIERYLNHVYLGNRSYGVKAAAENYFGKDLGDLSLAECALLAGLPQQPSAYNPADPDKRERAMERRDQVLRLLDSRLEEDFIPELQEADSEMFGDLQITHESIKAALAEPINVSASRSSGGMKYPYFTTYVVDNVLDARYGHDSVRREGLTVVTTLDPLYQKWAEEILAKKLDEQRKSKKVSQAVLMLLDAKTGEVLANVGGYKWGEPNQFGEPDSFNRGFLMRRQVGSSFKPFTYATAYEQGFGVNTLVWDGPNKENTARLKKEWPQNADHTYLGWISIFYGLQRSRNAASVDVIANLTGADAVINTARKMGLKGELPAVPSLTLGVADIQPIEMAEAYTTFANGGMHVGHEVIKQIYNQNGFIIESNDSQGAIERRSNRALTENTAWMMVQNMIRVVEQGTGGRARFPQCRIAGKTGTCDDFRDAWFVGYSPELICAVWVGNDDHALAMRSMHGGDLPAQIFHDMMQKVYTDVPEKLDENGAVVQAGYTCRYTEKDFTKPEGATFNGFPGPVTGSKMTRDEEGHLIDEEARKKLEEELAAENAALPDEFYTPWEPGTDMGGSVF